jgi:hypothetical protein
VPTAPEIRAWARQKGIDVPPRGNIPNSVRADYDAEHPSPNGSADTPRPDYPDDDFETLFVDPPEDEAFDESAMAEEKPRRPKASRARASSGATAGKQRFWQRGKPAAPKGKKKPRVSTEDLLGSLWRGAAKLAAPLPPLQRTLRIQAPVAGMLLEDAVKDTAADAFLQPLARLAGQGKVVSALVGPPVIVTALVMHVQQRAAAGQDPSPMVLSVGTEALRSSLMTWCEITEGKIQVALQREKEVEERFGQSVDELIAFLLAPPVDPGDLAAVQAEEDAIRRAQGIL